MRYAAWMLVALVGCGESPTDALPRPDGAVEITPPPSYLGHYDDMEGCANIDGDFSRVRWYMVPGSGWESAVDGEPVVGQWWPPHDIYLAESRLGDPFAVYHEVLHDLLQSSDHPMPPFDHCAPRYLLPPT